MSYVYVKNTNATNINLLLSFDGGTTYSTIPPQHDYRGEPKGGLTQVKIKSSSSTCDYEIILDVIA